MIDVNFNSDVVNIGSGNAQANNLIHNVNSNNVTVNNGTKRLSEIIGCIDDLPEVIGNMDYEELSNEIREQLASQTPSYKMLKRCFQAIPTVIGSISSNVIANQLNPYITEAVKIIGGLL